MKDCPLRMSTKDGYGCNTSAGFLNCNQCGLNNIHEKVFENAAKEIEEIENKEFLDGQKPDTETVSRKPDDTGVQG